jgi:hypothetical protein
VEKKTLFIGIQDIKFFTIPQTGEVGMQLLYPKDQTGLVPNIELVPLHGSYDSLGWG